jgi:DNA ligase (NAD+)
MTSIHLPGTQESIELLKLSPEQLESLVRYHNQRYWDQDSPEIPDQVYDQLVERLRDLYPLSPVLAELSGPAAGATRAPTVATEDLRKLPTGAKLEHVHPMLSLDKCYSEAELTNWFSRFTGDAVASHKIDGVAVSIRYDEHGQLLVASTRGNGRVGDVITNNIRQVLNVPHSIGFGPVEVRGEACMPLSTFNDRYAEQSANPRNLTAGALKQKNPDKTGDYGIVFHAYDILGADLPSELAKRDLLTRAGFNPAPTIPVPRDAAQQAFEQLAEQRPTLDFETDGIVFKVEDVNQHATLGLTSHHPRYAIAYKYQGESGESTLVDILWSVSRTGAINPVALIEPVSLSGVTVTRVSLHNLGIIERLASAPLTDDSRHTYALSSGARVYVTRRGGVIPHIESIITPGTGGLALPVECPSCGGPAERREDFLFATHAPGCGKQGRRQLLHFLSVTDIQGIGPKLMEQLFDQNLVREPADLFTLTADSLIGLERMGRKSAENIVNAIQARRRLPWTTFLAALGISDIGPQVARSLAARYPDFATLRDATIEDLQLVDGVGPLVADKLRRGLDDQRDLIDHLLNHLEPLALEDSPASDGPLAGQAFVFTGTMASMGRKEAQALVKQAGGTTPDSVTAATSFLVLGDEDFTAFQAGRLTSKMKAAQKLIDKGSALRVISETEFLSLVSTD